MKKYLSLVKLFFKQQFRVKQTDNKKKRTGTIVLIVVLGLCFLPMLIGVAVFSYTLGSVGGVSQDITSAILFICQGLVMIFGVTTVFTTVFNAKDADRLLYLPVSPLTVFLSKLTVVYITEAVTTAVCILFALVPYGAGAHASVGFFLMLPLAIVLVPVLPLLAACILAMPFSAVMTKLSKNSVVKTVVQLVLYFGILFAYMALMLNFTGNVADGAETSEEEAFRLMAESIANFGSQLVYLHPLYMLATAMTVTTFGSWALAFLATVLENAALLGLVMLVSLPFYRWILMSSLETGGGRCRKKASGEQLQVKNVGVLKGLISSDFKRIMRNSQMGFQVMLMPIMMPLLICIFYIPFSAEEGGVSLLDQLKLDPTFFSLAPLIIVGYMSTLGIGSNILGIYPISRENNALYILKCLPIPFEKILLSKVILATSFMLVSDFLTCLLAVLLLGVKWYFGIAMFLVMVMLCFGGMCVTTLIDLKSPKLGWTNFNQSFKNAKASWIAMLIGFLAMVGIIIVGVGFVVWYSLTQAWYALLIMWLLILGACFLFAFLAYRVMKKKAAEYFERMEL